MGVMKKHGVRKIVTVFALGVTDFGPYPNFFFGAVIRKSNTLYQFEDHDVADMEMRDGGTDYVLEVKAMVRWRVQCYWRGRVEYQ